MMRVKDMDFETERRQDRLNIEKRLDKILPEEGTPPASLHGAMRYAVLGGGKRMRGLLCLASSRIFEGPGSDAALDAACSIEILHAYTLVHDDLPALDDDAKRRGKPSCHARFGVSTAILAGDALQSLAYEILSSCKAPEAAVLGSLRILARTAGSLFLVGGQSADLEGEGMAPTKELVEFIHRRKTAELIAASLSIGGLMGGAGERESAALHRIGRDAGLAFQIVDDLLDLEGDEAAAGKGLRKDAQRGKITYPACFGAAASRRAAADLIERAVKRVRSLGDGGYLQQLFALILNRVS